MADVPLSERPVASTANGSRSASTCRWAMPTLFLQAPFWFESEHAPWTCLRDAAPQVLTSTEPCALCPRWEPRPSTAGAESLDHDHAGTPLRTGVPTMVDWFGAFQPPHETH